MRITNNITALNTHRFYTNNNSAVAKSAEKLSSGLRINRAGDDAAGLAISEKMRAQVRGLSMAKKNSQDAISLVQTAEGALQEVHAMLQRMNELAVQAASDTNEEIDRNALQQEFANLQEEIDQVARTTKFNEKTLLDGTLEKIDGIINGNGAANGAGAAGGKSTSYTIDQTDVAKYFITATDAQKADASAAGVSATAAYIGEDTDIDFTHSSTDGFETGKLLDTYVSVGDNPNANQDISNIEASRMDELTVTVGDKKLSFESSDNAKINAGTKGNYELDVNETAKLTFSDEAGNKVEVTITGAANTSVADILASKLGQMGTKGAIAFGSNDVNEVNTGSTAIKAAADATGKAKVEVTLAPGNDNALAVGKYTVSVIDAVGGQEQANATKDSILGNVELHLRDADGNVTVFKYAADDTTTGNAGTGTLAAASGADKYITFVDENGNSIKVTMGAADTAGAASILAMSGKDIEVTAKETSSVKLEEGMGLTYATLSKLDFPTDALAEGEQYTIKVGSYDENGKFVEYTEADGWDDTATLYTDTAKADGQLAIQIQDSNGKAIYDLTLQNGTELAASDDGALLTASQLIGTDTPAVDIAKDQTLVFRDSTGNFAMEFKIGDEDLDAGKLTKVLSGINGATYGETASTPSTDSTSSSAKGDGKGLVIQVGAEEGHTLSISIGAMDTKGLGVTKDALNISTREAASKSITAVREAINILSSQRAELGAMQNRLDYKINNLANTVENLTAAESRIRDTDMASEMTNFTKNNILSQAATAMLAQANALPQNVLSLLG